MSLVSFRMPSTRTKPAMILLNRHFYLSFLQMKKLMNRYLLLWLLLPLNVFGQGLLSPSAFLGYELGERFTRHHDVMAYFEHVAQVSDMVQLQQYGETYEHRPLVVALVSSADNLRNKEDIRTSNLHRTGLSSASISQDIPIIWLSYNVHGNESVSTEASMKTLYELVSPSNSKTKPWLENTLVIMDPCINPDGRDRYVNWYNQIAHTTPNINADDREHHEPWPRGRTNHYLFDLNRDWAWQSQQETQHRMTLYNAWFPQIHVDFHEQGVNSPYYFAPAAQPYHELITPWQRQFQDQVGKNHARYFDQAGWRYFTKEVFDLLYPSYGDTYPMFNGAIGMTYEQGGSGRAGLQIKTETSDTLSLKDRLAHHFTTGISTIEVTSENASQVLVEFEKFFRDNAANPKGQYKTFVVKGSNNQDKLRDLKNYLDLQLIKYGVTNSRKTYRGFDYQDNRQSSFTLEQNDLVISAYQPKSILTQVLFDPKPVLVDSLTYDITSWAIPYQYDLEAYALTERVPVSLNDPINEEEPAPGANRSAYAYVAPWKTINDARWLASLLKEGIKVRVAEEPFSINNQSYQAGTLVINKVDNEDNTNFEQLVNELALEHERSPMPIASGWVQVGDDLGSRSYQYIKPPKVALVSGDNISSLSFGECWHYFEQQLDYPITILDLEYFTKIDLTKYDVLVLPNGRYDFGEKTFSKIATWVKAGGRLILVQNAINVVAGKDGFAIKKDSVEKKVTSDYQSLYKDRQREAIKDFVPGAIFKVKMDTSHPLGYGFNDHYFSLKTGDLTFPYLDNDWNVGTVPNPTSLVSGFVGSDLLAKQSQALAFGVEDHGAGQVLYLVVNPLFRAFWYLGKLLMANAIFMVGQ